MEGSIRNGQGEEYCGQATQDALQGEGKGVSMENKSWQIYFI